MNNPGISKGISFGIASIVLGIGIYFTSAASYIPMRSVLVFIISFFFIYRATIEARHSLGGYITIKEAFVPSFSTWVIGTLISTLFAYFFINFMVPDLAELTLQTSLEALEQAEEVMGEEMIETAKESLEENGLNTGISVLLANWLLGLTVGAFISFVISLIVKREENIIK